MSVSALTQNELEDHCISGAIWAQIDAADISTPDPRLIDTLVALHEQGRINFLATVDAPAFTQMASWRRWTAQSILAQVLPRIEGEVSAVLTFSSKLAALSGDGGFYGAAGVFEKWCAADTLRAQAVADSAEGGDAEAIKFLHPALVALGSLDVARRFAAVDDDALRLPALGALARLPHTEADDRAATLTLLDQILAHAGDPTIAQALRVAVDALASLGPAVDEAVKRFMQSAIKAGGDQTAHQASTILLTGAEPLQAPDILDIVLEGCARLDPRKTGSLDFLDAGLARVIERGQVDQAVAFITKMASREDAPIELIRFDGAVSALAQGSAQALHRAVLNWLDEGDPRICFQLGGVLRELDMGERPWTFAMDAFGFSPQQVYFICRRAIGFFLIEETVAASILVCAIRTAPDDLAKALAALILDPLLMNYGGELLRYLEGIEAGDPAHTWVAGALRHLETYQQGLRREPTPELETSAERSQLARNLRADQMRASSKIAAKRSRLLDMVSHQYILYGQRTSTCVVDPGGARRWIDSEMASHGYSYEIPRQDVLDPIGLQQRLFDLRFGRPRA